ncbi:MAG TPA: hypothetical protein VN672_04200 [Solirubrobacteraceae bacterium]|nr:hypothetical protein [Solirubrobacteraceae bacterium]
MLSKPHDASARIAGKRTVLGAAVAGLLGALVFAGQAGADVPAAAALSGVTTGSIQAVAAPSSKDLPQAAGEVVAPATKVLTQGPSSTTQAAGEVVAPATKVLTQGPSSTTQPAGAATHAAPDTVAPTLSGPSSSPPLSAAPPSLGVEEPQLPLGGEQSSKGPGGPTILPGPRSILSFGVASPALASLGSLVAYSASGAGHNGPPPASIPSSPAPSPGGVSESTVAACGIALSIFLTLVGLAMLAAPRATRRLRLASEPWRLAPFVLIPERPG